MLPAPDRPCEQCNTHIAAIPRLLGCHPIREGSIMHTDLRAIIHGAMIVVDGDTVVVGKHVVVS